MERNEFSTGDSTHGESAGSTAGGFGNSGSITGAQGYSTGTAQEKLADVGSTVRDRAGNIKESLADVLESGADKLRQRAGGPSGSLAGSTGAGTVAIANDGRVAQVGTKVASGMDATAQWLRDADLDGLKTSIEHQVKEHPGRTLLMAVGVGYLLGKAIRK